MEPERWSRIDHLFGEALDLPEDEREAFLAQACGDDTELLDAVRTLLANAGAAGDLIGESVTDFAPTLLASMSSAPGSEPGGEPGPSGAVSDDADADPAGRRVGPYALVRELGRGGMGTVYLAERADGEFEKRVALKLITRGMDTDEVLRRFQLERRILAGLEHPNIARMYDGGATDDGRPYLVMELVEGERITDFCDRHRLGIPERLALFRSVCAAVQHAHQNLVVHRDLKPSNVMVTADGTPKLLDFGIARLLGPEEAESPRTRPGMRILTPEYAAPEQLRGEPVTTASDVYALGALLYEILAGRRPFDRRSMATLGQEEPDPVAPRPSMASGRPDADLETVAEARGTSPERLRRRLQGDLDTIVLKALEADPRLRYASAQQLMEDLDRHRDGLPVLARPPALPYRARKFARRHRAALTSGALVLLALVGGLGAALWQAGQVALERDRAEQLRVVAEEERDAAEEVVAFMEGMFAAADPFSSRPGRMDTLRVGALLDQGAERLRHELQDRTVVRARMLGVLGRVYRSLGNHERAEALLAESLEAYQAAHGDAHVAVASAMNALANLHLDRGRHADAELLHRQALTIRRETLAPDHPDVLASLSNLGAALQNAGRLDEAGPLYDEVLAQFRSTESPDSSAYADALNARMALAFRGNDLAGALPLAREILDINRALFGDRHARVAQDLNNLAQVLSGLGNVEEAEPLLRASLAMNREILGDEHPNIATGSANLASALLRLGRLDEAEPLYLDAIAMNRRLLGNAHPGLAVSLSNYADLLTERGQHAEAEGLYRESVAINLGAMGPRHTNVGITTGRLAGSLCRQGRTDEGSALFREALAILRENLSEGHGLVRSAESGAADCAGPPPVAP